MPKYFLPKLFSILILFSLILGLSTSKPIVLQAQQSSAPILIPLEKFVFTPARDKFTKPGISDLEVKVVEYATITEGSNCKFTFAQLPGSGLVNSQESSTVSQGSSPAVQTIITSKYQNASCGAVLKKADQKSVNIRVVVEITSPKGEVFGSYLNFLTNEYQDNLKIVDQNNFTLPLELYVKPEINVILERKRLFVGDKVQVQIEITNNDNFVLKEFSIKNTIPDKIGMIDCNSFKVASERLNGDIIKLPKVEVFAQNNSDLVGKCVVDQFNFEASLSSLKSKQTTRLNFDVSVEKPGKLKFEITTNLDQGKISKVTDAIEIIVPSKDSSLLPSWVFPTIVGVLLLAIGGGYGYYKYRVFQKQEKLNKIISSK